MMLGRLIVTATATLLIVGLSASCDRLPGKPDEAARWRAPTEVMDFNQLYAQNCSGCHGNDGRLGAARPLNDPLYLALVNDETLQKVIAQGVPKTAMPAFVQQQGGNLTDDQIKVLVQGIRSRWARSEQFQRPILPAYETGKDFESGDVPRGLIVYQTYCAQCHEPDGRGHPKGGSILDPNYLALVSDQSLRTTVIVGRSDLEKPDWRNNVPGRPMSPQEISDVVTWIASHRRQQAPASKANALGSTGSRQLNAGQDGLVGSGKTREDRHDGSRPS
jgi:mono/diheme cytochrome c family protein